MQSCKIKNRDIYGRRYKIQETWYIEQWCLVPFQVGTLGLHAVLPITQSAALLYFPESHPQSEICSPSKVTLVLGKARSHWAPNLGCRRVSHQGDMMFCQKTLPKTWCMSGCIVVMKLPITSCHSWGLLNHPSSFHGRMFKLNTKFDADLLLYSLGHFECNGHTVHLLTQWHLLPPLTRRVKSSLLTHAHCSPVFLAARLHHCCANHSCYINNGWTFSGQTSYSGKTNLRGS